VLQAARAEIRRRLSRRSARHVAPLPAPRYDDVFLQGSAELDLAAGEPIAPSRVDLHFIMDSEISRIAVSEETITAHLTDGRVISVPLAWSWRLSDATPTQRADWQIIGDGYGVHWPDVDEDIRADGMLNGSPARRPVGQEPTPKSTEPARKRAQAACRTRRRRVR
jgi:Protein of unknown function (DUF2442)